MHPDILNGKVALVTGGSRGIGRAVSLELARAGAAVFVNYLRKTSAAEEFAALLKSEGLKFRLIKANIEDEESIDRLTGTINDEFGKLDILVSNAVFGVVKPLTGIKRKHWDKTMGTNAVSLIRLARNMAAMPKSEGGAITALTSIGSRRVIKDYGVIGASKAALESVVRYLAVELGAKGFRANAVSPGVVETGALDYFPEKDKMLSEERQKTAFGALTTPEDVAELILFLSSAKAAKITGQVITIDGGASLRA